MLHANIAAVALSRNGVNGIEKVILPNIQNYFNRVNSKKKRVNSYPFQRKYVVVCTDMKVKVNYFADYIKMMKISLIPPSSLNERFIYSYNIHNINNVKRSNL